MHRRGSATSFQRSIQRIRFVVVVVVVVVTMRERWQYNALNSTTDDQKATSVHVACKLNIELIENAVQRQQQRQQRQRNKRVN